MYFFAYGEVGGSDEHSDVIEVIANHVSGIFLASRLKKWLSLKMKPGG